MIEAPTVRVLSGALITADGEAAYRIPLVGRDGAGSFALVDPEGLKRLRDAGARFLYAVGDGHQNRYVAFLELPSKRAQIASRAIIDAPSRRRVIYRNGDRLDLRRANLMIQPRKEDEPAEPALTQDRDIDRAWRTHRYTRNRSEGEWGRGADSSGSGE